MQTTILYYKHHTCWGTRSSLFQLPKKRNDNYMTRKKIIYFFITFHIISSWADIIFIKSHRMRVTSLNHQLLWKERMYYKGPNGCIFYSIDESLCSSEWDKMLKMSNFKCYNKLLEINALPRCTIKVTSSVTLILKLILSGWNYSFEECSIK